MKTRTPTVLGHKACKSGAPSKFVAVARHANNGVPAKRHDAFIVNDR